MPPPEDATTSVLPVLLGRGSHSGMRITSSLFSMVTFMIVPLRLRPSHWASVPATLQGIGLPSGIGSPHPHDGALDSIPISYRKCCLVDLCRQVWSLGFDDLSSVGYFVLVVIADRVKQSLNIAAAQLLP